MAKIRVHELAKEYGVESKVVLAELGRLGYLVKSASSTVEPPIVAKLIESWSGDRRPPPKGSRPATAEPEHRPTIAVPSPRNLPDGVEPVIEHAHRSAPPAATPPSNSLSQAASVPSSSRAVPATRPPVRVVQLHSLAGPRDVNQVLRACKEELERGAKGLTFDFTDASGFYPSAVVPVAAIAEHFRESGLSVEMRNLPGIAEVMSIRNPVEASKTNLSDISEPLSRLWAYFDHTQANLLTSAFMDCIRRKVECQAGVLEALEWCLYEVLDNVMQHSGAGVGFAMLQLHPRAKRLAACVSDTGIGVQKSLASSNAYRPPTAFDALTLAVREGVTRNKVTNQGNGLFGLTRIIEQNVGKLQLKSGRGYMVMEGDRVTGKNGQPVIGPQNHGTTVDFQLKVDKPVSIGDALNYPHNSLFMEGLESPDGEHVIKIREQAGGAGSRIAARELRTLIINVLNDGAPHIVLDFEGQAVVSSSFADEVIGKLFADMGFNVFTNRVRLASMNQTVSALIDRAIARRLSQS